MLLAKSRFKRYIISYTNKVLEVLKLHQEVHKRVINNRTDILTYYLLAISSFVLLLVIEKYLSREYKFTL